MDDLTVLARVHELDRILEADDIEAARLVQVIDQRRESGGLAGAGGAGDQHHALVEIAQLGDDRRQRELLEGGDLRRSAWRRSAAARASRGWGPPPEWSGRWRRRRCP